MDGAFAVDPPIGDDVLLVGSDRGDEDRPGNYRVPLIVGTNADEGKLFTRS